MSETQGAFLEDILLLLFVVVVFLFVWWWLLLLLLLLYSLFSLSEVFKVPNFKHASYSLVPPVK